MTKPFPPKSLTLADADITSKRALTRRSLLASLGLGLGLAAAAVVSRTGSVAAQGCTDNDRGPGEDPPGRGRRCRGRPTGCTDTDNGPGEDPPGYGRGCWI